MSPKQILVIKRSGKEFEKTQFKKKIHDKNLFPDNPEQSSKKLSQNIRSQTIITTILSYSYQTLKIYSKNNVWKSLSIFDGK